MDFWRKQFLYDGMPAHNNAFGNTNVTLRFKERHAWAYRQPVQFRFNRTGPGSADQHHAALPNVAAGNPNWYVYWQQVANSFGFGPQARMVYDSNEFGNPADYGNPAHPVRGGYALFVETEPQPYPVPPDKEWITLYDSNSADIVGCIKILHHENGHRQSFQLPNSKGGWGGNLTYYWRNDVDVEDILAAEGWNAAVQKWAVWRDSIHVQFENTHADFEPNRNDGALLRDRHHGVHNEEEGTGYCTRNEAEVMNKAEDIRKKDWSLK